MKIHTVWIQRKQRYEGQYLPELVAAMHEHGHDENPDYILDELEKHKMQEDVRSAEYIVLELTDLTWKKIQTVLDRTATILKSDAKVYPPA